MPPAKYLDDPISRVKKVDQFDQGRATKKPSIKWYDEPDPAPLDDEPSQPKRRGQAKSRSSAEIKDTPVVDYLKKWYRETPNKSHIKTSAVADPKIKGLLRRYKLPDSAAASLVRTAVTGTTSDSKYAKSLSKFRDENL
jgi:hypothetical protein